MDHERFTAVLRRFAGTLVQDYALQDVIVRLSSEIQAVLDVRGAGVMLSGEDGRLRFVSSSDPVLEHLEALQIELEEGPCLLAFRTGEPVMADDLLADTRFRTFAPRAAAVGMRAVYSFPLRHQGTSIGALNFYREDASSLDEEARRAGEILADVATAYILHAREDDRSRMLAAQLQGALDSRVVIEQAKGFLAARLDVSVDEAFRLLRTYARSQGAHLRMVAADVLARRIGMDRFRG